MKYDEIRWNTVHACSSEKYMSSVFSIKSGSSKWLIIQTNDSINIIMLHVGMLMTKTHVIIYMCVCVCVYV